MAQTLGPPLWATDSWATDAWADNSWATEVSTGFDSDDLTTMFTWYVEDLHDANLTEPDSNTLVRDDLATVRAAAAAGNLDDLNTLYFVHLHS